MNTGYFLLKEGPLGDPSRLDHCLIQIHPTRSQLPATVQVLSTFGCHGPLRTGLSVAGCGLVAWEQPCKEPPKRNRMPAGFAPGPVPLGTGFSCGGAAQPWVACSLLVSVSFQPWGRQEPVALVSQS